MMSAASSHFHNLILLKIHSISGIITFQKNLVALEAMTSLEFSLLHICDLPSPRWRPGPGHKWCTRYQASVYWLCREAIDKYDIYIYIEIYKDKQIISSCVKILVLLSATVSYDSWRIAFPSAFEASAQTAAKLDPGAAGFQGSPWRLR